MAVAGIYMSPDRIGSFRKAALGGYGGAQRSLVENKNPSRFHFHLRAAAGWPLGLTTSVFRPDLTACFWGYEPTNERSTRLFDTAGANTLGKPIPECHVGL